MQSSGRVDACTSPNGDGLVRVLLNRYHHAMETIDTLFDESLQLVQARDGYRFSLDPVLLADFVTLNGCRRALDLGSGCGILPLLLARRDPDLQVIGWERQAQMVERAVRGTELSRLAHRVAFCQADLRHFRDLTKPGVFDLVVTNPPYRPPGQGRLAPDDERAAARHELAGGLEDFLAAAEWALKNAGRFAIVYLAERLAELLGAMSAQRLEPKRVRMIHPRRGEAAKMVLVEGRKGGSVGLRIEPALYIYRSDGARRDYTDEVLRIYGQKVPVFE